MSLDLGGHEQMNEKTTWIFEVGLKQGDPTWRLSVPLTGDQMSLILKMLKALKDPNYETIGEKFE